MKRAGKLAMVILMAVVSVVAQPPGAAATNKLLTGKLMYVGPMPNGLNPWLVQYLNDWGKYKPTEDSEGVDLVMKAYSPPHQDEFELRNGIPQPAGGRRGRKSKQEPAVASVGITDWVTGESLWHVDIVNRKQKKNEADLPAGPRTKIFARGMSSQELAEKITAMLRAYVGGLNPTGSAHHSGTD